VFTLTMTCLNSSSWIAASTADRFAYSCSSSMRTTVNPLLRHDVLPCGIALLYIEFTGTSTKINSISPFILMTYKISLRGAASSSKSRDYPCTTIQRQLPWPVYSRTLRLAS
jgi:hypothetical protein